MLNDDVNTKQYHFRPKQVHSLFGDKSEIQYPGKDFPKPRSGHRIVATDEYLYTFGGYNPNPDDNHIYNFNDEDRLFKEIWRFNLTTHIWSKIHLDPRNFPKGIASGAMKRFNNSVIIHGGTGFPFGQANSNETHVLILPSCEMKKLETSGDKPPPLYGQACAIDMDNKVFYVLGGTAGLTFSMDIYCLDLKTLVWSKINAVGPVPEGRYRHEIAIFESKLIVFGGGTQENSFGLASLPIFNLITRTWDSMRTIGWGKNTKDYPRPRRCFAGDMVHTDNSETPHYTLCGGFDGSTSFDDIWSLNLSTYKWTRWQKKLPGRLYFHDGTITPSGRFVVFGGIYRNICKGYTSESYRTNLVVSSWIKIPKLREIAWEALISYLPHLKNLSAKELMSLGVPADFASRVT